MAHVFNKILGKKDKGLDIFILPDKKYCKDGKKLAKMEKKDLLDQIEHMDKYISILSGKLQQGRKQYERSLQKIDQLTQKLNVVNSKMAMISNEHEQLQVKFTNLQNSLEFMTKDKESIFKAELQFIEARELSKERVGDLGAVLKLYREQIGLLDKIAHQNKQLKVKYSQLETEFFSLSEKITEAKAKSQGEEGNQAKNSGKSREETEPDDEKNSQVKLILEAKQQMVVILNKKIGEIEQKNIQLIQTIGELNHEIQKKSTQVKQKNLDIAHLHNQNGQIKRKAQELREFQELILLEEQNYKEDIAKKQSQIQRLNQEIINLKEKIKLVEEEKRILIGDKNQNEDDGSKEEQDSEKQMELMKMQYQHQLQAKDREIENVKIKLDSIQKDKIKLEGMITEYRERQKDLTKIKQNLAEQIKARTELSKQLHDQQQNFQIKLKKLEFTSNQQRIKAQSLKRTLTNLQQKEQEQRKKLDEMYQKKVVQDSKLAKMQNRLKHYKDKIQYLQKQKVQMERTFEDKMKNMEEIVLQENQEEEQVESQPSEREIIEKDEAIISKLKSKIVDLEEEIQFLKEQNRNLINKKDELQESNLALQKNFKVINEKRQQMIRQFSKMNSLDSNIMPKRLSKQEDKPIVAGREKKIAQKALKGFDIFSKHLSNLYKEFLNVHISDIQRKEIKQLEGQINSLVGRCEDMKDIFQGYL